MRSPLKSLEAWRDFKAVLGARSMVPYQELHNKTGNSMHALMAYRIARASGTEIPEWILILFDTWAEALTVDPPRGTKEIAQALSLKTKGGPSVTLQGSKQLRDFRIVERVHLLRRDLDRDLDRDQDRDKLDVFLQVAEEFDLSVDRIQGIWYDLTRSCDSTSE